MVLPPLLRVLWEGELQAPQTWALWGEMWHLCDPAETLSLGQ